jgi:hypothetical protein
MTNKPTGPSRSVARNVSHNVIPPVTPKENAQVIDLDQIRITALTGVHRASIFMGLGVNAADDPAFVSYQLKGPIQLSVTPHELSDGYSEREFQKLDNW